VRVRIPKTPPAMSAIGAVAANIGPTGPVSLQDIQSDPVLFLDSVHWFQLLQDDGKEMTREEVSQYLEPTKGKKQKKKYKNIAHGGYFYPELYSLAGNVLALLETKRLEYFLRLLASQKNMSNALAGNVGCWHVGQRVKTTDIFYVGDMSADMLADMSATCPKNMSAAGR
jgi:hypothetical protein